MCGKPPSVGRASSIAKLPIGAAIQATGLKLIFSGIRRTRNSRATQPSSSVVPSPEGSPVVRQWEKLDQAKTRKSATSAPRETRLPTRRQLRLTNGERDARFRATDGRTEASKEAMRAEHRGRQNDHEHHRENEDDHRQQHLDRCLLRALLRAHLTPMPQVARLVT